MVGWIVFLAVAVPLVVLFGWMLLDDALVQIPSGRLGLLLVKGRATDKVLEPGPHWVPALRRRMVEEYPSIGLVYRAVLVEPGSAPAGELAQSGPAPTATLGDRARVRIGYTVRFRLDPEQLRGVHERFGPDGIWSAARDLSEQALRRGASADGVGVDDLFGSALATTEAALGDAVTEALGAEGLIVTMFALGDIDLGRTGDVIQSTVRARLEQEREEAEAAVRVVRARVDAELEPYLTAASDAALRYREVDVWRDLVYTNTARAVTVPGRLPVERQPDVASEVTADVPDDTVENDGESTEL